MQAACEHEYRTTYVNDRQTVTMDCNGREFGAVQAKPDGRGGHRWLPRFGQGLSSELPGLWERDFPSAYLGAALGWIEERHRAAVLPE